MFDMNSMKKLTDEVPDEMKEELKNRAMEKLGLSNSESGKSSAAAAPSEQAVDQAQSDNTPDTQVSAADQTESTDEDTTKAA